VFTGNPTPSVYWRMERSNKLINLTHNTTIIANTVILSLTITDNLVHYLGSYQCVAVSEAGYISRTTRILPKGNLLLQQLLSTCINDHNEAYAMNLSDLSACGHSPEGICRCYYIFQMHMTQLIDDRYIPFLTKATILT